MTSAIRHVTIDSADAHHLAGFWSQPKTVKNRVHLDLEPRDRSRDEEVERVLALGATLVDDRRNPDGTGWAVLADPEGNEFCVERSAGERAGCGTRLRTGPFRSRSPAGAACGQGRRRSR